MNPSIDELEALLESEDLEVRRYAVETLGTLAGPEVDRLLAKARIDENVAVRVLAKRFLKARGIPVEASSIELPSPEELTASLGAPPPPSPGDEAIATQPRPTRARPAAPVFRMDAELKRRTRARRTERGLRPLDLRQILERARLLYGRNASTLLGASLILHLPLLALGLLVGLLSLSPSDAGTVELQRQLELARVPLYLMAVLLAEAVVAKIAADELDGDRPRLGRSLFFCYDRAGAILSALLVKGLILGTGGLVALILLLCPGFGPKVLGLGVGGATAYGFLVWSFVTIAATLENIRGWEACQRSASLVIRNRRKVFNLVFLLSLAMACITAVTTLPAHALGGVLATALGRPPLAGFFVQIVEIAVNVLCHPFLVLAMTLLYFDFLIRFENLELRGEKA